jgi:hypothetical protein
MPDPSAGPIDNRARHGAQILFVAMQQCVSVPVYTRSNIVQIRLIRLRHMLCARSPEWIGEVQK